MSSLHSLEKHKGYRAFPGPLVLVIMDGVGLGRNDESNGVHVAHTPVLDRLLGEPLFTPLRAHGTAVGLPSDDDMGNSEVGHNALGAGRVLSQGAKLVNEAVASGGLFQGAAEGLPGLHSNLAAAQGGPPVVDDARELELKLLASFLASRGRVLSRQQLLQAAWGSETFVTDRAVDAHIVNLRRKIEVDPREPRYIVSVRGLGYRFDG